MNSYDNRIYYLKYPAFPVEFFKSNFENWPAIANIYKQIYMSEELYYIDRWKKPCAEEEKGRPGLPQVEGEDIKGRVWILEQGGGVEDQVERGGRKKNTNARGGFRIFHLKQLKYIKGSAIWDK